MTSTQKFEGPELGALLDHVHSTLGPDVQIVEANRCRSRGVAGFFARETFEVTVEVPDSMRGVPKMTDRTVAHGTSASVSREHNAVAQATTAAGTTRHGSVLDRLIAAADDADELAGTYKNPQKPLPMGATPRSATPATAPPLHRVPGPRVAGAATSASDRTTSTHIARFYNDSFAADDTDEFGELLERAQLLQASGDHVSAQAVKPKGSRKTSGSEPTGIFGRRRNRQRVHSDGPADTPRIIDLSQFEDELRPSPSVRGRVASGPSLKYRDGVASHSASRARTQDEALAVPSREDEDDAIGVEGRHNTPSLFWRRTTSGDLPDNAKRDAAIIQHPSGRTVPGDIAVSSLAALGVPAAWLSPSVNGRVLLDGVLNRILEPPVLIRSKGTILAFVGEGSDALVTARAVAAALRQDPASCVFLSPGDVPSDMPCVRIKALDDVAEVRDDWAQRSDVTIVAVDAGFGRQDVAWGRYAISLLHPVMRWGVVSASRKAEDVHAWARGMGGLHALAVNGIAGTASPLSILASGVPVARIDGQVASRELWRKIIDERLTESASRRTPDLIAT